MRRILLAASLSLVASGALAETDRCPAGMHPATTAEVFFGEDLAGGGQVSDADWRAFMDGEITPRFPSGLTVLDVYGQWRGASGFVREPSKALFLVLEGTPDEQRRIELIREAYKHTFRQESVLLVEERACVSF